jgi:hypothetical protein
MVGAEDLSSGGEDVPVFGFGFGVVPLLSHHPGDLVSSTQRVRVVMALCE